MHPTPIVSMYAYQVERRQAWHEKNLLQEQEQSHGK
jgi:hypothetical protein